MKTVEAASLLGCSLESPVGATRTRAVLPFFDHDLRVKFLLIVPEEEGAPLKITRDLPTGVVARSLSYRKPPRLRNLRPDFFKKTWHFDPWWLMRERDDIARIMRNAVIATNLAGKALPAGALENFRFDDALLGVHSARIGVGELPRRKLAPMLQQGPVNPVD